MRASILARSKCVQRVQNPFDGISGRYARKGKASYRAFRVVSCEAEPPGTRTELPAMSTSSASSELGNMEPIVVVGATGGVGKEVVLQLASQNVKVRAIARDVSKAQTMFPQANVEVVGADVFKYQTIPRAVEGGQALICATGPTTPLDPFGPFNTDFIGTRNLVAACEKAGSFKHFVLVSSIGADDSILNPLNLFWGVLFWKKRAEEELQRSSLRYTIVRPGGLVTPGGTSGSGARQGRGEGEVVLAPAGTYGIPPKKRAGSILRSKVAECCIKALTEPGAADAVVEVVADTNAPLLSWDKLFAAASSE